MESKPQTEGDSRSRILKQEAIASLGQRALETDDIDQLMHDAAVTVTETLDTEYCSVLELVPGEDEVRLRQGVGWDDGQVGTARMPTDRGSEMGYTLRAEEPVVVEDLHTEERFSGPELLTSHGIVSGISVVIGSIEDPKGILSTHTTERRELTDSDASFVRNVANILASASEHENDEEERRRTERQFEAVFEDPNILVGLLEPDGTVLDINETAMEYIDADLADVTGEPFWETPWWGEGDGIQAEVKEWTERAANGEYVEFEADLIRSSGERYTLSGYFRPVTDDDGEVESIIVSDRDITARKERERELAESEARFRMLAENLEEIVWMATPDAEEFVYINPAFEDVWGLDRETLYDEPLSSLDAVHPDDRERIREQFTTLPDEEFDEQFRIVRPDGEPRWIYARGTRVTDGGMTRIVGIGQDVTERKEQERELERALDLLEKTERIADVGGWEIDVDTAEVFWTDHTFDLLEIDGDEEPPLDEALDMYHEEDRPAVEDAVETALDSGEPFDVEARIRTASGEVRWLRLQGVPETVDGDVVSLRGAAQDVTERKRRERQLEESEARFRMLAENLEETVWISDPGAREILYLNPAFEEIWGRDRESLYGDPLSFLDAVHPVDRQRVEQAYAAVPDEEFDEEYRIVRPDGAVRWLDVRAGTVRSEGRERVVGIAEDVTERKERERTLEESERRYRTLVENFPNGAVGLYDEDLEYTAVGGQLLDVTGVDPEDRIGSNVYDIYPGDLIEELEPYFHAALDGEANAFEVEFHGRHLYAYTLPVRNADDDVFAGMLVVQDVTERHEYERKLEESNERLEQFAYAASHDLQEPLRMVSSYLQLLEQRYEDELDEDGEEFLEFAVDGADRMREMIDGLLQYSRVDTRGDPFAPVDLDEVLADVRENLQVKIEEHDAGITAEDLPVVSGDVSQLNQVFQNLVDNAIEYSGDAPPQVHIAAERDGDEWLISVSDEGIGIDPGEADRVFEVFESLRGHDEAGTGIGLALCERIVERHGGDIWVDSAPGEGATFSFTLPAAGETDE